MTGERNGSVLAITGASTGIGAATARRAAEAGWRVVLGARRIELLERLAAELGPDRAAAVRCDVIDWEDQQALVAASLDRFGGLDAVFANAGFGATRGFTESTVEHWRDMVLTNVLGVAMTIRAGLPHFRERGGGHFLITGSTAGRRTLPGSLYSATKFAAVAMGEALRQEVADSDIRVTVIEPGMVDTDFFDQRPGVGPYALADDDVARAVMYALDQPPNVDVSEVLVRPVRSG